MYTVDVTDIPLVLWLHKKLVYRSLICIFCLCNAQCSGHWLSPLTLPDVQDVTHHMALIATPPGSPSVLVSGGNVFLMLGSCCVQ